MTSQSDVKTGNEPYLRLEAGVQALVAHDSLHPSVSVLPPSAYQNLLVVSPKSPTAVERLLEDVGADVSNVGHLPLASTSHGYSGSMWAASATDPSDLTGLSMRYTRALRALDATRSWVLFDDFNTLIPYNEADRVVRFLTHLSQVTRKGAHRGVYTVVRDAMGDQTYSRLRNVLDAEHDLR